MAPRVLSIFLSTPSDVAEERRAIASLVAEINDVVAFLAPERSIQLKLIHYETDTYPDMGGVQPTINRQIPVDYDIHFGVMWKRCGTKTQKAASGTIEEFERALVQREKTGRPTIMFYFGADNIPLPTTEDEIDQLRRVLRFRARLDKIGLTATYPTRAEFRERARVGLLRAVADILREELPSQEPPDKDVGSGEIPEALRTLCESYDRLRSEMKASRARTQHMSVLLDNMKAMAPTVRNLLPHLQVHRSAGYRLAAVAILQVFPARDHIKWLADRLDPEAEKPFVGYQAVMALLQAVRSLPKSDCAMLRTEVTRARKLALLNPHDPPRIDAIDYTMQELKVKCP